MRDRRPITFDFAETPNGGSLQRLVGRHDTILPMRPTTKRLASSSPSGLQPRKTRRVRDTDPAGRANNGGAHRHPISGNRPNERLGEKRSGVCPEERPVGENPTLPPNYGYSDDSIKAKAIYDKCTELYHACAVLIGPRSVAKLEELSNRL